jgi:malonate transporter MadL subunit
MVIIGTALLAVCYLVGMLVGEGIAVAIGVKANVGGVGIAMLLLIACQYTLQKRGLFSKDMERGITFWAMMYIPVVVAMAATQNVLVAAKSGPIALLAAAGSFAACVLVIAVINRGIEKAHIASAPFAPTGDHERPEAIVSLSQTAVVQPGAGDVANINQHNK